jgi:hypothetical protein
MGQATAIATVGVAALTGVAVLSVKAFNESAEAIAQTNAVLASTKGVAGVAAQQVTDLATSLQKVTKFSDEDVRSVENLLLTFTAIGKDIFPEATKTVLDMATALGEDTKSASIQLGKALQDPVLGITALRRVGVNFSDAQKDVIKNLVETGQKAKAQQLILKELHTEFGGSAEAAGKTFAGSLAKLNNSLNDVEEAIGQLISNALIPLVDWFSRFVSTFKTDVFITKMTAEITELTDKFIKFTAPIRDFLVKHKDILLDFLQKFAISGAVLIPVMAALSIAIATLTSPLFLIISALTIGWELWERHRVLFLALTVVLGPLALAFVALRAALMFQEVVAGLNLAIVTLTGTDIAATLAANGLAAALWAVLAAAAGPITIAVVGIAAIWATVAALQSLNREWDAAIRKSGEAERAADAGYNAMVKDARQKFAAGQITKDRLNALTSGRATGGPVTAGQPYIVGEHRPELFVPNQSGTILPSVPSGATYNITVQAGAYMGNPSDARRYAEMIANAMKDLAGKKNMSAAEMLS